VRRERGHDSGLRVAVAAMLLLIVLTTATLLLALGVASPRFRNGNPGIAGDSPTGGDRRSRGEAAR